MEPAVLNTSVCAKLPCAANVCLLAVLTEVSCHSLPAVGTEHSGRCQGEEGVSDDTFPLVLNPDRVLPMIRNPEAEYDRGFSLLSREGKCTGCPLVYWHIDRSDEGHRLTSILFGTNTTLKSSRVPFVFVLRPVPWQWTPPWYSNSSVVLNGVSLDTLPFIWG